MLRRPGFPHSDILGSRLAYQLPEAYRRLLRPSSAPDAKASTVCSSKLDHIHEYESCLTPDKPASDMTNGFDPPDESGRVGIIYLIRRTKRRIEDARVHCVVLNIRSVLPAPGHPDPTQPEETTPAPRSRGPGPDPSGPNSVHAALLPDTTAFQTAEAVVLAAAPAFRRPIVDVPPVS